MKIQIYCDALQEGEWFKNLSPNFKDADILSIKDRGKNPRIIDELIEYDRPDIILVIDGKVKLALEKTEEVPTGHNVGQRFARIVKSAEVSIPFIYFCPFVAMKHGKYANRCFINARLFTAIQNMSKIHNVSILAMNWVADADYELIRTGEEDREIKLLIKELFNKNFQFEKSEIINDLQRKMEEERKARIAMHSSYDEPPNTVKIIDTSNLIRDLKEKFGNFKIPKLFIKNKETVFYTLGMTPKNCRREDPFTGMQLVYDYYWCRTGPKITDRKRNLVLNIPLVDKKRWLSANPNEPHKKRHLYYTIPDALVLKDGIIITENIKNQQKKLI